MSDKPTEWGQLGTCELCGHSLANNGHGFDQNDGWMEGDKLVHSGRCTYCKECRRPVPAPATAPTITSVNKYGGDKIRDCPVHGGSMEFTLEQAKSLVEVFGKSSSSEVTVTHRDEDLVAYFTEYPEEGCFEL